MLTMRASYIIRKKVRSERLIAKKQFKGYLSNIRALINGGKVKGGWYMGDFDENGGEPRGQVE